jgi:Rrf2 family transcriptional regulator, nitric oxide-sensitive transcriptional repressor
VRLTVYTDFSLRLLIYLAVKQGGLATIAEVAESYGISRNHLMKVAHQLGLAGYVATVRGKNGGLRLARPAETVILGDVVRRTEPDLALVPCFHPVDAPCAIWPKCVLREAMQNALEAFLKTLDGYTLADLARPASQLRVLLSIAPSDRLPRTPGKRALRLS